MRILLGALLVAAAAGADEPYGFRGFEIYKVGDKIGLLTPCDVDGDGLQDLLVVNNDKAKIEVFLRRKTPVPPKRQTGEKLPNDLADDQFFERKEILTEKAVSTMVAGDFNGDGRIDVAYYGKPEELAVACGDGKGAFPETKTFPLDDGLDTAAGDLDGDGRTDLVLLAKSHTAILYQTEKGRLAEPVKLPHAADNLRGVMARDLDGDGRTDLVLLSSSSTRSVRARFQRADGSLGAEIAFETSPWRVLEIADVDPATGAEVLVVQRSSGLLRALKMHAKPALSSLGTIQVHAFDDAGSGKPRSMAVGDVDGDGRADIVVTEPAVAQVAVYLQDEKGGLKGRRLFGSLANAEAVRVADLDGNGKADVVVLSGSEKAVGIAQWTDGRLPFPTLMDLPGTPKAVDTGDLDGDGRADLVVVAEPNKGERNAYLYLQGKEGGLAAAPASLDLAVLKQAPDDLMVMDVDQDGHTDLLLFDRFGPMRVWQADGKGGYLDLAKEESRYRGGLVSKIDRGSVTASDIDGNGRPELLVATRNYARAIVVKDGALTVQEQANGATPRSQVKGAASLDLDGDGTAEIVLYDRDKKSVTVLARDDAGVFAVTANLAVGELDFQAMATADLNGDGQRDLVLFGKNRFGVLYARGTDRELIEAHAIESSVRDARLGRFAVGDLNGDGRPDLAALDDGNSAVQVFSYDPAKGFEEALYWRVFEKKLHERRRTSGLRDIVVTDLDGDGRNDIAVLVHDRLVVYPQ